MIPVSIDQMRKIDEQAIREYGIPSILLMENAGQACAREILNLGLTEGDQAAIFCGKGNNGGDGFVAARHLYNKGIEPVVFYFQNIAEMKPDSLANFKVLEKMDVYLRDCSGNINWSGVREDLKQCKAVLDALFGTGLSKTLGEPFKAAVDLINECGLPVVAVDIPSGLNADTGEVMGVCVRAKVTVSLALPKKGFYLKDGPAHTGKIVVADISIPRELIEGVQE